MKLWKEMVMRTLRSQVVAIALAVGLPALAAQFKPYSVQLKGEIVSVDPANHALSLVRKDLPAQKITVVSQAEVLLNGRRSALDQLKPGQKVSVRYDVRSAGSPASSSGLKMFVSARD